MKKNFLVSLSILALIFSLAMVCLTAHAESETLTFEDYSYTLSDNKATITGFNTAYTGYLDIPSMINGYPVTKIGDSAFLECEKITGISIPEGITHIGNSSFEQCRAAEKILLPQSLLSIGEDAFSYCDSLKEIIIPENADDIGPGAFDKCYSLEHVSILSSPTSLKDQTFSNCQSITEIIIPKSVEEFGYRTFFNHYISAVAFHTTLDSIIPNGKELSKICYSGTKEQFDTYVGNVSRYYIDKATHAYNCTYHDILNTDGSKAGIQIKYNGTTIMSTHSLEKDGYTYKLFTDIECTKPTDINTVSDYDVLYIKYKKIYPVVVDGEPEKNFNAIYGIPYIIDPPVNPVYAFDGYYTEPNGKGVKLTDENGNSLEAYTFTEGITAYPYYTDYNLNKIFIDGPEDITVGQSTANYTVSLVTSVNAPYCTVFVSYPSQFSAPKVTAGSNFADVTIQNIEPGNEYDTVEILCMYTYDGACIPVHTLREAFTLSFSIPSDMIESEKHIRIESGLLFGYDEAEFDVYDEIILSVNHVKAESIVIYGSESITGVTRYYARFYPDGVINEKVTWLTDDESVATISSDGTLTPLKPGTVIITATSVSYPEIYATKTVTIEAVAVIDSLSSDTGIWYPDFDPYESTYIVIVPGNTESITLSPQYTNGTVKYDNSTILSHKSKEIPLNSLTTEIQLIRGNVAGFKNKVYEIFVDKATGPLYCVRNISENTCTLDIFINPDETHYFETAWLIVVPENSDGSRGEPIIKKVTSPDDTIHKIQIDSQYTTVKTFLWSSDGTIKPLCKPLNTMLN